MSSPVEADNSTPRPAASSFETFFAVFDAIARKEDISALEVDQDLVVKLSQRIEALKSALTKEYEI